MSLTWGPDDDTMFREDVKRRHRQAQVEEAVARFIEWRQSWLPAVPMPWTESDRVFAKKSGILLD